MYVRVCQVPFLLTPAAAPPCLCGACTRMVGRQAVRVLRVYIWLARLRTLGLGHYYCRAPTGMHHNMHQPHTLGRLHAACSMLLITSLFPTSVPHGAVHVSALHICAVWHHGTCEHVTCPKAYGWPMRGLVAAFGGAWRVR